MAQSLLTICKKKDIWLEQIGIIFFLIISTIHTISWNETSNTNIIQWFLIPYKLNKHEQGLLVLLFSGCWHYDPVVFSASQASLQLWLVTEASAVLWPFSICMVEIRGLIMWCMDEIWCPSFHIQYHPTKFTHDYIWKHLYVTHFSTA